MRIAKTTRPPARARGGAWGARAACVVGLLYACVNAYWGAGGTRLLDTVGGSLARLGHAHDTTLIVAIWGTVALQVAAALLPLLALPSAADGRRRILLWGLLIATALLRSETLTPPIQVHARV